MALSTGTRTALGEAASWLVAGAIMIAGVVYFDELKAAISPMQPAGTGYEPQIARPCHATAHCAAKRRRVPAAISWS